MKQISKISLALILLASLGATSSCDRMYQEGTITPNRIQIVQEEKFLEYSVAELDEGALDNIAYAYNRQGSNAMYMTITYDPKSANSTAMKATQKAAAISKSLQKKGVSVHTDIMPVRDSKQMNALISYSSHKALEPDCGLMSGIEDRDHRTDLDYKMGCSVETMIARQVARPKDLLGRAPSSTYKDGRGISNQVEGARSGAPNPPLDGETATE